MSQQLPSGPISPDGLYFWDGRQWVPRQPNSVGGATPASGYGQGYATAYAVPAGLPAWTRPYESASSRGRAAALALWITAGLAIFAFLVELLAAVYAAAMGHSLSSDAQLIVSLLILAGAGPYLVCLIVTGVLYLMWLHRVTRNLPILGTYGPRFSPAFAVGGWFIPFWSAVHGFLAVREAWRGSDPAAYATSPQTRKTLPTWGLLFIWWVIWGLGNLISYLGNSDPSAPIPTLVFSQVIAAAAFLLWGVAAALAAIILRDLTARQEHKAALIATGQLR